MISKADCLSDQDKTAFSVFVAIDEDDTSLLNIHTSPHLQPHVLYTLPICV